MEELSVAIIIALSLLILACVFLLGRAVGFNAGVCATERWYHENGKEPGDTEQGERR